MPSKYFHIHFIADSCGHIHFIVYSCGHMHFIVYSCGWNAFLRSSDWSEFTCRDLGAGLSSDSGLLWFFGMLCMVSLETFPEFSIWKTILLSHLYFFTQKWKVETRKRKNSSYYKSDQRLVLNQSIDRIKRHLTPVLSKDWPSINQSTVPQHI